MYIQVINFNLKGISETDYCTLCDQLASAFVTMPGLISKVWLTGAATNTYGGVYTWEDKAAMQACLQSELFNNVINHPDLTTIASMNFGILEGPTQVMHGLTLSMAAESFH